MKFFVSDQHRQYYREHGAIEFEAVVSMDRCAQWERRLRQVLCQRLNVGGGGEFFSDHQKRLEAARGLWRDDAELLRFLRCRHLAEVAYELTGKRPLRLGGDSYFIGGGTVSTGSHALEEVTCYRGLACGVLLRLTGAGESQLPREVGNALYLSPSGQIDLSALVDDRASSFLLFTYLTDKGRYVHCELDPHTHIDKRDGYAFGDRLRERGHPTLFR